MQGYSECLNAFFTSLYPTIFFVPLSCRQSIKRRFGEQNTASLSYVMEWSILKETQVAILSIWRKESYTFHFFDFFHLFHVFCDPASISLKSTKTPYLKPVWKSGKSGKTRKSGKQLKNWMSIQNLTQPHRMAVNRFSGRSPVVHYFFGYIFTRKSNKYLI